MKMPHGAVNGEMVTISLLNITALNNGVIMKYVPILILIGMLASTVGTVQGKDIICSKDLIQGVTILAPCPKFIDGPRFTVRK
jgi:hypothetical protein